MSHYAKTIAKLSGADPAMADLIEEVMRTDRTALDGLTEDEFRDAIAEAITEIVEMHDGGYLPRYCEAMRVTLPASVALWAA